MLRKWPRVYLFLNHMKTSMMTLNRWEETLYWTRRVELSFCTVANSPGIDLQWTSFCRSSRVKRNHNEDDWLFNLKINEDYNEKRLVSLVVIGWICFSQKKSAASFIILLFKYFYTSGNKNN